MNNRLPCELVRDLFPSYIDGLTSDVTNEMVVEHVDTCMECRHILDAMKEPSAEPVSQADSEEIDFLKKTRRKNQKIIIGSIAAAVMLIAVVLVVRFYLVGNVVYSDNIACKVSVDGSHLILNGILADEKMAISAVEFKEKDGVVTVSFKAVKKSPFCKGGIQAEYEASEDIEQVCLGERIVWSQGQEISAMASAVYHTKHAYIGDMSANSRTAKALNLETNLGGFSNELQTSEEPYGWKITLNEKSFASQEEADALVPDMKAYAYMILAVIDNIGEVTFEYNVDGKMQSTTITMDEASAFFGQDIKICGQNVGLLQQLIEKTGLGTYAYIYDYN